MKKRNVCVFCLKIFEPEEDYANHFREQHQESSLTVLKCVACGENLDLAQGFIELGPGTTIYIERLFVTLRDTRPSLMTDKPSQEEAARQFMPCVHPGCFIMFFDSMAMEVIKAREEQNDGQGISKP